MVVGSFKLAINMAGAVSAGAYTAGVLDFLFEALDQWYGAKANGEDVPAHDVSIEALSGASAGGMCAAIAAATLQGESDNRLYDAWVNAIDIRELLKTQDLEAESLLSLLDSTVIGEIARTALKPGPSKTRNYVSPNLTLLLTVTNLRGVPYALFEGQTLTPDEYVTDHADAMRFELVDPGQTPRSAAAHALTRGVDDDVWSLLRTSAMATGAFPAFLAPCVLRRSKREYAKSPAPAFPKDLEDTWTTVNVDGGVTNNSPFVLASDYLAALDPQPANTNSVDRAVLTIAPFPGNADWNKPDDVAQRSTFFAALGSLTSTLLSQSRFAGESMAVVAGGPSFSRFFIAPSGELQPALQCGLLSAFGGFFERSFRAHDFQLGRRNCQRFLEKSFLLPDNNRLFSTRGDGTKWLPIIPLLGTAKPEVGSPQPGTITRQSLQEIVDLMEGRFHALLPHLLAPLRSRTLRILIGWSAKNIDHDAGQEGSLRNTWSASLKIILFNRQRLFTRAAQSCSSDQAPEQQRILRKELPKRESRNLESPNEFFIRRKSQGTFRANALPKSQKHRVSANTAAARKGRARINRPATHPDAVSVAQSKNRWTVAIQLALMIGPIKIINPFSTPNASTSRVAHAKPIDRAQGRIIGN